MEQIDLQKLEQDVANAYEKQIARAILDAIKLREESYQELSDAEIGEMAEIHNAGFIVPIGDYTKSIEDCLIESCEKHKLSKNMWHLLSLAIYWWNDIQLWAEDVLAGKDILEECKKEDAKMKEGQKNAPCCDSPSEEKCEQC